MEKQLFKFSFGGEEYILEAEGLKWTVTHSDGRGVTNKEFDRPGFYDACMASQRVQSGI